MAQHHLIQEVTGSNAVSLLKRILNDVDLRSVTKIRIEVYSESEIDLVDSQEGAEKATEQIETINGIKYENVPHVGADTDGFAIIKQLHELSDFVDMPTIRQQSPKFAKGESLSGTLWSLADRGLIEKKSHPKDGRKKVYKLTTKGEAALMKTHQSVSTSE